MYFIEFHIICDYLAHNRPICVGATWQWHSAARVRLAHGPKSLGHQARPNHVQARLT